MGTGMTAPDWSLGRRSPRPSVVLVTGAASGIGKATAQVMAALGARVAALDVQETVREVVAELEDPGRDICRWSSIWLTADRCRRWWPESKRGWALCGCWLMWRRT